MKKGLTTFAVVFGFLALLGGGFFLISKKRKTSRVEEIAPPESTGRLIETSLEERPYVILVPRTDGREFTLEISRIKNAKTIEYELVYFSNNLSRGAIGSIDVDNQTSISRKLLLGTCSRDVCKYDENVTEGSLTLRFRSPDGVRKFVTDFHLQKGADELTSIDGNFKLAAKFSPSVYYLTMSTIGLPGEITGKVIGQPYGVFTSGSKTVKNGAVGFNQDGKIYARVGKNWEPVADGEISSLTTFIIVETAENGG